MAEVRERAITRDAAVALVQSMIRNGTPNYLIRDALVERGLTAYMANAIIREVRRSYLYEDTMHTSATAMNVGLFIVTLIIIVVALFLLISPVQ